MSAEAKAETGSLAEVEQALLTGSADFKLEDATEVARAIVGKILEAESESEVWADVGTIGARDVIDRPLTILGVRWNKSGYDEGLPVYAIMDCVDPDSGETLTVTCGAAKIMARLLQLQRLGLPFPKRVKVIESAKSAQGFTVLDLARA